MSPSKPRSFVESVLDVALQAYDGLVHGARGRATVTLLASTGLIACGPAFETGNGGTGGQGGEATSTTADTTSTATTTTTAEASSSSGTGGAGGTGGESASSSVSSSVSTGVGGAGGADPCPDVTFDEVAQDLGGACNTLFPNAGECGTQNPVPRNRFISAVIGQVDPKFLQGYEDPTAPTYPDVPLADGYSNSVEKAVWLDMLTTGPGLIYNPAAATDQCFEEDVLTIKAGLPTVYEVIASAAPSQTIATGPITTVTYTVYGTTAASPLNTATVANNLMHDFGTPQPTTAVSGLSFDCNKQGAGYVNTPFNLDANGQSILAGLNCHNDGAPVTVRLQLTPSNQSGSKTVVGLAVPQRRGWSKAQGGKEEPTITVQ